jgi:hypothetical protein
MVSGNYHVISAKNADWLVQDKLYLWYYVLTGIVLKHTDTTTQSLQLAGTQNEAENVSPNYWWQK